MGSGINVYIVDDGARVAAGTAVGSAVVFDCEAINVAPLAVLSPSNAGGFPSIVVPRGRIWTIGYTPPHFGHETM